MKTAHLQPVDRSNAIAAVPMQPASWDIWDQKYRLKAKDGRALDETMDGTRQRVARALAAVETTPELRAIWYEKFLWALRHGAIPAGRIISNAGAWEHKPATSTINCTVSGTILDSMDDILRKVHEAGLTLKAGCVAPGTQVFTDRGLTTADTAVAEQHAQILCYDREQHRFEMRAIEAHLTVTVARDENIEIRSNGASLTTSIHHPVLVYRDGNLQYVRADEVTVEDGLVHYPWEEGKYLNTNGFFNQSTHYLLPKALRTALAAESEPLSDTEREQLGFYHGHHRAPVVGRIWLDRWQTRFPHLGDLISFARTLRPVDAIRRGLDIAETFYDFTVERHNNYLAGNHGLMVIHNCGIGYEFSTLRPRGAYVSGAGAYTSGPLSFMDIYDKMCFTVSSAGGRRGAQMGTFDIGHPDVIEFIRAKREAGRLRQFNLSLLITREFMEAVKHDEDWQLAFPLLAKEAEQDQTDLNDPEQIIWREWPTHQGFMSNAQGQVACKVYRKIRARRLWDAIMASTYDYAEPGFILIDEVNAMNNNWFCENIRATNPCGELPLPEYGSCLLGSINLTPFVQNPLTDQAEFDWDTYREVVAIFTRMLDNVVEINGLPLEQQRQEIFSKRRHGMGYLGLGSTLTLLRMKYGSPESLAFTEQVTREMALTGWRIALELAREKGPAPILEQEFTITAEMLRRRPELTRDGYQEGDRVLGKVLHARYSRYMQRVAAIAPQLVEELAQVGARFTHHTSIAPTGTIALSLANNASNGIEPSFAHHYSRNLIRPGKKSKERVDVFSFELLAYRHLVNPKALPDAATHEESLPDYFTTADAVSPKQHVDIQAAAQKWVDSSISKTANIPTDFPYEDFKDIYLYAYEQGLKGCTTFRFNPEVFQGVLVKEQDLANTRYLFVLEDGSEIEAQGNEDIEYDTEVHTAANLFDALKEGYYGKF